MDIVIGSVVMAKSGRDKGLYFVVTDILENGYVFIADGKRRKLQKPKKKNIAHIQATCNVADEFSTNRQIRQYLRDLNQGGK